MSEREDQPKLKELQRALADGRMDRRTFLQQAAALGIIGALGGLSLATWPGRVHAADPKRGGHFRCAIANGGSDDTLDPARMVSEFNIHLNYGIRNNLTEINGHNELVGELAESFEPSDGGKTWVFKLRKDVEFHNGKALDAKDVVASIDYHRREETGSVARNLVQDIEELKTDGRDTVIFKLSSPNADFPYVVYDYHFPILPSDGEGNVDWKSGVGTGGYTLETFEPGNRAAFKRFPNYWKADRAHFDSVELLLMSDTTARTNALITDSIDAMDECELRTVDLLQANPNVEVDEVTTSQHISAPMDTRKPPFDDNNVRLALKLAFDRKEYLDTVFRGHATIGNDHPIAPHMPYYAGDIPQREYDPDKARHHLKKAGLDKLDLKIHTGPIFSGAVDSAVLYQQQAKKAGINIQVVQEPADGFWSDVWMAQPWTLIYWGARPTPDMMFSIIYAADSDWNDTYWKHERFNKLLAEARSELDEQRRAELYREMQLIVRNQGGSVIPAFNNHVFGRRADVRHTGHLASYRALDGHKAMERWWFA